MKSLFLKLLFLIVSLIMALSVSSCKSAEELSEPAPEAASPLAIMFDNSKTFSSNLTGFALYDPEHDSTLYSHNASKYFTPASNTKLFTFYAGLKTLPENLRALEYVIRGDSLIFWGTGDPSFLQNEYGSDDVYNFLKNSTENLFYSDSHYDDVSLGPGWSWDDYNSYYSAEKSPFPIYGNMVRFTMQEIEMNRIKQNENGLAVTPKVFQSKIKPQSGNDNLTLLRGRTDNQFTYGPVADTTTYDILRPFHYTPELITEMLSDTLDKPVGYVALEKPESTRLLYSVPSDTAFKRMLQPSDNLIAEQLLLMIASERGEPLNAGNVIEYIKSEFLADLPDEPQWVDGSGLSRYNMFTPRSIIRMLEKIDDEFADDEKLFELLPAGGKSGTISSWYGHREGGDPYVFAKTGTLRNNHCLSGYIITKSRRKLLFSFMNNHYVTSSSVIKEEMEKVLWHIYSHY